MLAVFVLIGLLWGYLQIDVERSYDYRPPEATLTSGDRPALTRHQRAVGRLLEARGRQASRRRVLADRREEYRTALDEGRRDPVLQRLCQRARAGYAEARGRCQRARAGCAEARAQRRAPEAPIAGNRDVWGRGTAERAEPPEAAHPPPRSHVLTS